MGMRFRSMKVEPQPVAVTTRVGADAGWSIGTWPQPEPVPIEPQDQDDEPGGED